MTFFFIAVNDLDVTPYNRVSEQRPLNISVFRACVYSNKSAFSLGTASGLYSGSKLPILSACPNAAVAKHDFSLFLAGDLDGTSYNRVPTQRTLCRFVFA